VSLFKRGNIYWTYFYEDGVRHQYSTGTSSRRQAKTIEARLKEEVNNRRFQIVEFDPDITFGAITARFIASGSACPHHMYHLRFLLSLFSEVPALRVTKALADEFRKRRRAYNPAIKDATINRDLSVLRHILYWAVDEQLMTANPLARLKMAPERRIRRQILSLSEEALLLGAAKGHLRAMIVIALDTGMRRGEITRRPRLFAVQAANCAALAAASAAGAEGYVPFTPGATIADGIATVKPVRTLEVLRALRRFGGGVVAVPEADIAPALGALGRLGLFVEPTAATGAAALSLLLSDGTIRPGETTIVVLTGHGLKATDKIAELLGV